MAVQGASRIARPGLARRLREGFDAGSVLLLADAGYGKTMALEEAVEDAGRRSIWLVCQQPGGGAGRLLIDAVEGLRAAVPGLADVFGDTLAGSLAPLDARSATAALRAELEGLLVEPLTIVFDEAEALEGDEASLALVEGLLNVRGAPLSVAIATRRPLPLKLAKLRASARLVEIGPAELSLTPGECEDLLRLRHGKPVSEEEVAAVVAASEGWPMGVALSVLAGTLGGAAAGAVPREELFGYLAEEVLEGLDPQLRTEVIDSSVPASLSAELAAQLGLAPDFLEQAEHSGLFLRAHASGERSYHPLFREFLQARLREQRSEAERAALHERAAASLAGSGREAEAVEHWLTAGCFEQALGYLASAGAGLLRTSPETVSAWLDSLPEPLQREPECRFLEGQLAWGAGFHERAVGPLRAAVAGFVAAGDEDRAWFARIYLADTLVFLGEYEEVSVVAAGWELVEGEGAAVAAMAVAWFEVVALVSLGRVDAARKVRELLWRDPDAAAQFSFLDVLSRSGYDLAAGFPERALERLHETIAELELDDPHGRLPYALGMVLVILRNLGERDLLLGWIERCERGAERVGLGFALRDFRLQKVSHLARSGDLAAAESELARVVKLEGTGWRGVFEGEADAHVAALRGDAAAASAAALRGLRSAETAPMPWRVLVTIEMAEVLAEAGDPDGALAGIETTMVALEERFPGERGRLHRAWLLTTRACVEHRTGELEAACASLARAWEEADDDAGAMVRRHWPGVRPVLWDALAEGALDLELVTAALQDAFAGGEALVAMVDHPQPGVRRAALRIALSSGHPAVLARLGELAEDSDETVAAAAGATRERLRATPPPLRFELLGGFRVRRAGWELAEAAWERPMAARIVRFLLIHGPSAVPEDALFDAFWADRPSDTARQHLAVALSRARKVLDLPGAEGSAIEVSERTYRLALRERDSVDSAEFEAAAGAALAEHGPDRSASLQRAAGLWSGEPLPEDRYAEWPALWRERLLGTYSELLGALIESHATAAEYDQAIRTARRLLEVDPLNEAAHRSLMLAYARTGRTSHALRQYLECRRGLVVELGVEPAAETSALHAAILAGEAV